jgi:hypothetical protein
LHNNTNIETRTTIIHVVVRTGAKGCLSHRGKNSGLLNEVLPDLYFSLIITTAIKSRMRWAGHVARMGYKRNTYRVLVGKPEGKTQRGRPGCRWQNDVKIDLKQIKWQSVYWIRLAKDRDKWRAVGKTVMNTWVP